MKRRPQALVLIAALGLTLLTARLGVWQLDRAAQKTALQQEAQARGALPPLRAEETPRESSAVAAVVQRRVVLQGRWLADATVALENRPMAGRTGFYIVTPLQLDSGAAVLVQRGWLPRDNSDRTRLAPFTTPSGVVQLQGRIAPHVPRLYEFDAAASGPIRQNLDLVAFARERRLVLLPWVLIEDAVPGAAPDGLLRQWPEPASGVAKHHGYAFQWFALSALTIVLYVWFQFIRPRRAQRPADGPA
jgi:surfeit locus 1 family protein